MLVIIFLGIFHSISAMVSLNYHTLSRNILYQTIGDIFGDLQDQSLLDLSFNNFTGDLPNSFDSLSNLSSLYLQNNQLTGMVNILANLDLTTLNIANNQFIGWIPQEFSSIPNLQIGGNSFSNGPAPPPPPYTPPPPSRPHRSRNNTQGSEGKSSPPDKSNQKSLTAGPLIGIIIGSILGVLCIILAVILCHHNVQKGEDVSVNNNNSGRSVAVRRDKVTEKDMQEQMLKSSSITSLNPPTDKVIVEKLHGKNGSAKRPKGPITATSYTVASLQVATNSFSQDCLIGEGSLGRVYNAEFPNGKVLAAKKIDSAAISLQEEDNFLEAVSNISRLRHPNMVTLSGYFVEHGQRLLVYEYIGNGTLHDILHCADSSTMLPWNARVRVALGTARALEYLHEVCLPSVVHRNLKSANIVLDEELNPHL